MNIFIAEKEDFMATHSSILAWRISLDKGAAVHGITNSWL